MKRSRRLPNPLNTNDNLGILKPVRPGSNPPLRTSSMALLALLSCLFFGGPVLIPDAAGQELTMQMLRDAPDLSPEAFMAYFRDFSFKLGEEIQDPAVFLATRTGDCDDFASLAASLFRERNMTTELIAVYMSGQTHVVCYVPEAGVFLDFNLRASETPLQKTDGLLEDIAEKVSTYFRSAWHCVAVITSKTPGPVQFGRIAFH